MRVILLLLLTFSWSAANADEWRYEVIPYIWWPDFQADSKGDPASPPNGGNLAFESEITLDAAFLIATSATKDRHVLSFEFDWVDVNTDADGITLGVGARHFDLDIDATLEANIIQDINIKTSDA